jgi:DNA-binding phage protein
MARTAKIGKPKLKLRVINVTEDGKPREKPISELSQSERQYFRDLHKIIDEIFAEAANSNEWSWSQLASHAGLAYQTVANLGDRATKWPRFLTIYRLAKAVGWELVVRQTKVVRKAVALKAG